MKREEFRKKFDDPEYQLIPKMEQAAINNAVINEDLIRQQSIAMEECCEFAQAISKFVRNKGNWYDALQEMADVMIVVEQQRIALGISDDALEKAISIKMDRIKNGEVNGYERQGCQLAPPFFCF